MPPRGPLSIPGLPEGVDRTWRVPGSKSLTNRALILAALADGTTILDQVLESDDTRHMGAALTSLGIEISSAGPQRLKVQGGLQRLRPAPGPLFIGNSGTSVRFLTALCALVPGRTTLIGDSQMAKRPIADLVDALGQLGVQVDCPSGCPPLTIHGGTLRSGVVRMRGDRSSQYLSGLLLSGGVAGVPFTVEILGELVSRPYVDITCAMIRSFGGVITEDARGFHLAGSTRYQPCTYAIEPDASSASYVFALAAAGGHRLAVPGLDRSSLQGDYRFLELLETMGARIDRSQGLTVVQGVGPLSGIDTAMRDISDTVMTLAAIAPRCTGTVTIRDIANIRIKETDRMAATVAELNRLGARVESGDDWMRIHPAPLHGATIECYHDHRMAMSFAVLGTMQEGVAIADPACTSKTYPGFWDDLAACYAQRPW